MFEAGESIIVATGAIGMGRASASSMSPLQPAKFDGQRLRRLTIAEMAQIAGRAGRHQQDGSFGTVGQPRGGFTPEEVAAIEGIIPAAGSLFWRNPTPRWLARPALSVWPNPRPTPRCARRPKRSYRAQTSGGRPQCRRAAAISTVQRLGTLRPARFRTIGRRASQPDDPEIGNGAPAATDDRPRLNARRQARLTFTDGDIDQLKPDCRSAHPVLHRPARRLDRRLWWAEQAQALESRLSDALHAALSQRFVDRRLALLLRDAGQRHAALPVAVGQDGTVAVDGEAIGTLRGFSSRSIRWPRPATTGCCSPPPKSICAELAAPTL